MFYIITFFYLQFLVFVGGDHNNSFPLVDQLNSPDPTGHSVYDVISPS